MVHDMQNSVVVCIRGDRCAFYHDENDRRKIASNGCKLNVNEEDIKSSSKGTNTKFQNQKFEQKRFAPFSPFEEVSSDVDVYQRKHARTDYMMNPLPSLSRPVAVGVSQRTSQFGENSSNYSFNQNSHMDSHHFDSGNMNQIQYKISPSERESHRDSPEIPQCASDSYNTPIYNNHLFDGNTIPSRQHSYSENAAYPFNRQYSRGNFMPMYSPMDVKGRPNYSVNFNNPSPSYERHTMESTTPSSEMLGNQFSGKIEADPFKYLSNEGNPYERRADSLKYSDPPGLSGIKYKVHQGSDRSDCRSQNGFAEQLNEKLQSNQIYKTQRKITEDHEFENISQKSSQEDNASKPKRSKMCKNSVGFIPKHLRDAPQAALPDEITDFVDNLVSSRKASRADEEEVNPTAPTEQEKLIEQDFNKLIDEY
mmetsp:Transcript_23169/g.23051  ORF Transcript_23169/g.23051 Transcript_23169/m.23051 type:complete len:423 (-) Transcript_23169:6-1274(-)